MAPEGLDARTQVRLGPNLDEKQVARSEGLLEGEGRAVLDPHGRDPEPAHGGLENQPRGSRTRNTSMRLPVTRTG